LADFIACLLEEKVESEALIDISKNRFKEILPYIFNLKKNHTTQDLYNALYFERYITHGRLCYSGRRNLYHHFLRQYPNLGCFKDKIVLLDENVLNIVLFQSSQKNKICFVDCDYQNIKKLDSIFSKHKNIKRVVFKQFCFSVFLGPEAIDYLGYFNKNVIFQDCNGDTILHLLACTSRPFYFPLTDKLKNHANIRNSANNLPIHYAIQYYNYDVFKFLLPHSTISKKIMAKAKKAFGEEEINRLLHEK